MRSSNSKTAFTLVELLVVIAIIGTLMGMLLPAVQSAREAGRRNTCTNNLSQLGKAMIAFDGKFGYLPGWKNPNVSGTLNRVASGTTAPFYSWTVQLLPSLERRDIYNAAVNNPAAGTLSAAPYLEIFNCPSSPADITTPSLAYAGNCGSGTGAATTGNIVSLGDGVLFNLTTTNPNPQTRRIGLDFIGNGDGTASTLCFSEKNGATIATQLRWSSEMPASFSSLVPGFEFPPNPSATSGQAINNSTANNFLGSNHPGAVVAVFCDGHTMLLRETVAPVVLTQLMTSRSDAASPPFRTIQVLDEADFK